MRTIISLDVVDRPFDRIQIDYWLGLYQVSYHPLNCPYWVPTNCFWPFPRAAQHVIDLVWPKPV